MAVDPRALLERFRLSAQDLAALRKSAVLTLWLKKTWSAWLVGIAYSAFAQWIFPAMMRPALRLIWPPNKGHGLQVIASFINNNLVEDPRVDQALSWLAPLVWLVGFSLFLALLELRIRPAIEAARNRSRTLEHEADARQARNPAESILLLNQALHYAVDGTREKQLRDKLAEIDVRLSRGGGDAPTAPPPGAAAAPTPGAARAAGGGANATLAPDGTPARRVGVRGRYRLEQELARGGMGVVWRGFDTVLERPVAVKELPATTDPSLKDRFRQEALALARLSHANVVQVYDFLEEEDERLYIAMELVDGGDLDSMLRAGALSVARGLDLARQIALGLGAAHKRGIVHRDVKPLNVLVTSDGTAKVTDFGLAKLAEASAHTVEGSVLGSPRYMSPEQADGKPADARSDVYSFGATLFHMFAGRPPFEGETSAVLAQHLTKAPPALSSIQPSVPKALDPLVASMLAKKPEQRPQSLEEIAARLGALR